MTKEIIIDGCNVAECEFYVEDYYCEELIDDSCSPIFQCKDRINCYFKQLQRLKKELEIKEKQSEHFMIGSGEVLDKLKQENEQLKIKLNAIREVLDEN